MPQTLRQALLEDAMSQVTSELQRQGDDSKSGPSPKEHSFPLPTLSRAEQVPQLRIQCPGQEGSPVPCPQGPNGCAKPAPLCLFLLGNTRRQPSPPTPTPIYS